MKISQKQIEAILKLDGQQRYNHFIKTIADTEKVFGLYRDGWALASDGKQQVFPLWSAKEYAELCSVNEWNGYKAKSFTLNKFTEELLPNLKRDGVLVGIFYTPSDKGVTPDIKQVLYDLGKELENYE